MTLDEAVLTLFETLGEPTDFNPYGSDWITLDPTSRGYSKLTNLLNSGQMACANYKTRRSQIRFSNLIANTNVTIKEIVAPFGIITGEPYKIYINKSDLPNPAIAEISETGRFETSFITMYDTVYKVDSDEYNSGLSRWEITLTEMAPTDGSNRIATINKNSFYFLPANHPWVGENFKEPATVGYGISRGNLTYILKINNATDQEEIKMANLNEDFLYTSDSFETPTQYILLGREIKFDTIPPAGTRFTIDYYRTPSKLIDGGETFEIPEQFHYGIVMWATWQGLIRMHELETSRLFKNDFDYFMQVTKNDNDYRWERTNEGSSSIRSK